MTVEFIGHIGNVNQSEPSHPPADASTSLISRRRPPAWTRTAATLFALRYTI